MESKPEELFKNIGLDAGVIKNTLANPKVTQSLVDTLKEAGITQSEKKIGNLLYAVATRCTLALEEFRPFLAKYIGSGKLNTAQQLELAITYLKGLSRGVLPNVSEFESKCGIGIVITEEQIRHHAKKLLEANKAELQELRYAVNLSDYLRKLREELPFAEGALLTKTFNAEVEALLGPKTKEDDKIKEELAKKKAKADKEKAATKEVKADNDEDDEPRKDFLSSLVARDLSACKNSAEVLKKHEEFTGGKVITRFPPEPNGYLHIGHAKAMRFSFMAAAERNGHTYLRFDDTNPDKENIEYIENIKKNVAWLGYKPWKITHASDYFEDLYNCAVQLIKKDKAFICEQPKAEMQEYRKIGKPSPWRNRPIEDSLRMFDEMRRGLYEEGKVSLRLKIDPAHENPTMRDPVAYRIKYTPHPHVGDKWCVYPVYDFTHCINDSLEHVTHSLCTLEFEVRRDLYYWILEQLDIYRPFVWEYSRLNISNTVLSKRKLHKLIFENYVKGWDDPRIHTLNGLRRRGYTSEAINEFCDLVSVTRRGNENIISYGLLEHCIRKDLDQKARRTMAVIDPVKLILTNVPEDYSHTCQAPLFPKDLSKGTYEVRLTKELYVERTDILLEDNKDFFGFAPNKVVGLKYAHPVKVVEIKTDLNGNILAVHAELLKDSKEKPKGYVHWLPVKDSIDFEARIYDVLFTEYNPNALDNYLEALNPNSLVTKNGAKLHKSLIGIKSEDKFQFERVGFFSVDYDSDVEKGRYVFNKTVGLVDKEKQKAVGKK